DVFADPHFRERQMIIPVPDVDFGQVQMQNVIPRMSRTPGTVWRTGPDIGQHNHDVYLSELGLSETEQARLREAGII
ncbi:MAG: CoA transferase, partial [Burkholderiaceae bacterium]